MATTPFSVCKEFCAGDGGASNAKDVKYDNTNTELAADNVGGAIDEICDIIDNVKEDMTELDKATAETLSAKEVLANKSVAIDDAVNDTTYPTTKAVKDYVDKDIKSVKDYTDSKVNDIKECVDAGNEINTIVENAEGVFIKTNDSANAKLKGLHIYGKTTQADTPTVENPQELVSVGSGGSIRADVYSGNLIPFPYEKTEHTSNGVTFVVNDDGSITVNGTATADAYFNFANSNLLKGTYHISGCPSGGSVTTYYLYLRGYDFDIGQGRYFTVKTSWSNNYQIMIKSGYTANNLVFKPQLNVGTSALPYSKGHVVQTATFNTPNGLPGLPVASGGNYTDENGQQWICDEIDLSRGKYVQRIYKYINTGERFTGNVFFTASANTVYFNYQLSMPAVKFAAISTHFKHTSIWNEVMTLPYVFHITASHLYFSVNADDVGIVGTETKDEMRSLVSDWFAKTFSTENPLIVYYILETPIETDLNLTEEEIAQYKALTTHKPVTNIFNDANAHMSVEYVADPKAYIDNKFNELQNAVLSLGGNV